MKIIISEPSDVISDISCMREVVVGENIFYCQMSNSSYEQKETGVPINIDFISKGVYELEICEMCGEDDKIFNTYVSDFVFFKKHIKIKGQDSKILRWTPRTCMDKNIHIVFDGDIKNYGRGANEVNALKKFKEFYLMVYSELEKGENVSLEIL